MKKKHIIIPVFLLIAITTGLMVVLSRSGRDTPPTRIFLIILDTTRADHVDYSLTGNTLTPITLPSHASIFYSQPPHSLRVFNNKQVSQAPFTSVAQHFKKHGYRTGAVISLGVLSTHFGLEAKPGKNLLTLRTRFPKSPKVDDKIEIKETNFMNFSLSSAGTEEEIEVNLSRRWKKIEPRGKLHYFSERKRSRIVFLNKTNRNIKINIQFNYIIFLHFPASKMLYRQEMQYMDYHFGQLIDFLKKNNLYEDSFFLVMGDHGEGLGEHRECVGHIHYLNKLYLNVPLFLAGKGVNKHKIPDDRLVSNLNIAPTLLEVARVNKPDSMQGVSLFQAESSGQLLLETYAPEAFSDGFSIIKYPHQIIYYPQLEKDKFEFIDLSNDPLGYL